MARHQCALWNQRGLSPEFPHRTLGWNASWWFSNAPDAENSPLITGRDKLLTAAITSKLTTYSSCCRPGQYDPDKWTTCSQKQIGWHEARWQDCSPYREITPGGEMGGASGSSCRNDSLFTPNSINYLVGILNMPPSGLIQHFPEWYWECFFFCLVLFFTFLLTSITEGI